MLDKYAWPGNVRELINAIEGAVSEAADEPIIFFKHMPDNIRIAVARSSADLSEITSGEDQVPGMLDSKPETSPLPYRDFREQVLSDPEKNICRNLWC
jgi:two-component system NtrC family response regulator